MARRKKLEEDERKMDREMIEAARRQMEQETDQARAERQQALRDGLQRQIDDKRARQESEVCYIYALYDHVVRRLQMLRKSMQVLLARPRLPKRMLRPRSRTSVYVYGTEDHH